MKHDAASEWSRLDGLRRGFITRCEQYANYTLPRLCTPTGFNPINDELSHDWHSVGAQAVNHVTNKLVLTLFAPSRPSFRLEADKQFKASAIANGIPEASIDEALARGEQEATKELDRRGTTRPKLYQLLNNLVVLGNVLAYFPTEKKEDVRVFGIKNFVVRRTGSGKVKTCIVREQLLFDELEPDVQAACRAAKSHYQPDTKVDYFRWLERQADGKYRMSQWVGSTRLPSEYEGHWPEDKCPWRVLTWQLADDSDYGTGLVEDFAADFSGLSSLSEAQIKGAILSSEFRWLVNPGGMTKPEDLMESENGAALPGLEGDIALVSNSKPGDLQVVQSVAGDYIRRIGQGFLLGSAVTRDAERVTAAEIRQQAQELETSFGGAYSRIAVDLQNPLARWLLQSVNLDVNKTQIKITIVTGLDALSRGGDLDSLRSALADIAALGQVPPDQVAKLELEMIYTTIFNGHGLPASKYVKSAEKQQAEAKATQDAAAAQTNAEAGSKAAADQIVQQGNQ